MTVKLTDVPLPNSPMYSNRIVSNKIDQFLTSIHSMSVLKLETQDFYLSLGNEYKKYSKILRNRILELYPNSRIKFFRLEKYIQWQFAVKQIPKDSDLVLLQSNHDMAYVNRDPDFFYEFAKCVSDSEKPKYGNLIFWPEALGRSQFKSYYASPDRFFGVFSNTTTSADGTCLISRRFFESWWESDFTNGSKIVRPDNPFGPWVKFSAIEQIFPSIELFRHMDGSGHVGNYAPIAGAFRACCTIKNEKVIHSNLSYGNFWIHQRSDLPLLPALNRKVSQIEFLNLMLLACSYRIDLANLMRIFKMSNDRIYLLKCFIYFMVCLPNRYFFANLFKKLLPINRGNGYMYRIRCAINLRKFLTIIKRKIDALL
jgi:hypothetical protein